MDKEFWRNIVKLYSAILDAEEVLGKLINGKLGEYGKVARPLMNEIKQGDKVEVFWLDAAFEQVNMPAEDAKKLKPMLRSNLGYLIDDDGSVLRLSFGKITDQDKSCSVESDILIVPREDVKSIKKQGDVE